MVREMIAALTLALFQMQEATPIVAEEPGVDLDLNATLSLSWEEAQTRFLGLDESFSVRGSLRHTISDGDVFRSLLMPCRSQLSSDVWDSSDPDAVAQHAARVARGDYGWHLDVDASLQGRPSDTYALACAVFRVHQSEDQAGLRAGVIGRVTLIEVTPP